MRSLGLVRTGYEEAKQGPFVLGQQGVVMSHITVHTVLWKG